MLLAKRISPLPLPKPNNESAKLGLRYERNVLRRLKLQGFDVEHNPWFQYKDGVCCPDILIYILSKKKVIICETKLKYRSEAEKQLIKYCDVVSEALNLRTSPFIIYKYSHPSVEACSFPHLQWLGYGPIVIPV